MSGMVPGGRFDRPTGCFWLTVYESGGGGVSGWIDRDAAYYPKVGAVLYVVPSAPLAEAPRFCGEDCATEREIATAHIADLTGEVERLRAVVASLVVLDVEHSGGAFVRLMEEP